MSSPVQPVNTCSRNGAAQGKRHILLLNHVSKVSGGEQGLLDIIASVDARRYRFTVAIPDAGALADRVAAAGAAIATVPFRRFARTRNPLRLIGYAVAYLSGIASLVRLIRRLRPDLVHANSNMAHLYGGVAARLAGVPAVWHSRDLVDLGLLGRGMFGSCRACVAISHAVAAHVSGYADDSSKIHMIYNGIDTERFAPRDGAGVLRSELGLDPDAVLVGTVGQLVPWKKHEQFLTAAARVSKQAGHVHVVIVGDDLFGDHPGYRDRLKSLAASLAIADRVHVVGYREDIVRVLADLDLVVHAAEREPFGRALAEAMAMGKPVVAIGANGPAELVRDGIDGTLVPAGDATALAAAIRTFVFSPDRREACGKAARERIVDAFSRETFGRRMTELYDAVIPCV